jgi:SAM-dependent methyltransferase
MHVDGMERSSAHGDFEGHSYQQRFDALEASGVPVHGEADFVARRRPRSVLDAGCGTGRVAIELARRGIEVLGVDVSASMLAIARERAPQLCFLQADLTTLELERRFDLVVMAGNVPLFTQKGTEALLISRCAAHLEEGGLLVAGFQLGRGYDLATYDAHCLAAGLVLEARFSTWDEDPFCGGDYAVSCHRAPS